MIKKILTILVIVLVVATVGVVSADQYQKYQSKHKPVPTVTVPQKDAAVNAAKASAAGEYNSLKTAYDTLSVECGKGLAAYNALPVASKAKTPQPQCSPAPARQ